MMELQILRSGPATPDDAEALAKMGGDEERPPRQPMLLERPQREDTLPRKKPILKRQGSGGNLEDMPVCYVYMIALYACINSANCGFDGGVTSGVVVVLQQDMHLSIAEMSLFVSLLNLGACTGGVTSHWVSDNFGRRATFAASQVVFIIGIALQIFARSFYGLGAGRLLVGLGMGIGFAVDPLYIAEVAPAAHRGKLTSWSEIAINIGALMGYVVSYLARNLPMGVNWRVMIACGMGLPLLLIILAATVMPESPRWLIQRGEIAKAKEIFRLTHGPKEDVDLVVEEVQKEIEEERKRGRVSLRQSDRSVKWGALISIGVAVSQQLGGSDSLVIFAPSIFKASGLSKSDGDLFLATIVMGFVKAGMIIVSLFFIDSYGRRPLLLISTLGGCLSMALLAVTAYTGPSIGPVVASCLYFAAFSLGIGPITWLLAAELIPLEVRAKVMGFAAFGNRFTSFFICITYLPMVHKMGVPWYFGFFSIVTFCTFLFVLVFVPETKRYTLEQLTAQRRNAYAEEEGRASS